MFYWWHFWNDPQCEALDFTLGYDWKCYRAFHQILKEDWTIYLSKGG